jgi:hypothetical protein
LSLSAPPEASWNDAEMKILAIQRPNQSNALKQLKA